MPTRSLSSSVLRWPDAQTVDRAVRRWAEASAQGRADVIRIGYFGSYARGDWGVGSDLDVIIIVDRSAAPFETRAAQWDATDLPVPVDVLVYTKDEWESLPQQGRFHSVVMQEAVWVLNRPEEQPGLEG